MSTRSSHLSRADWTLLPLLLVFTFSGRHRPPLVAASPAAQDEPPAAVVYLPLTMLDASRADLHVGPAGPGATALPSSAPPTAGPGPTSTPTGIATETPDPTVQPSPSALPSPTTKPDPPIEIDGDWVRTPHYALLSPSEAIDKQELGRMMEQFYDQATAYFGAEPEGDERLVGKIFADDASYRAGLAADGIGSGAGGSGGYFDPGTRTFYLFVQPSRHYTRMLTLHEATHQMQRLAGDCSNPGWWTEGEAEHLGMHTWDGETLQLVSQPLISLEDHPRSALEAFQRKGRDVGPIVAGSPDYSYREAWALVSFVRATAPREFRALRARYCAGEASAEAWRAVFGRDVDAALNTGYETWLQANQQPWTWVWNTFEPLGPDGFHGVAMNSNALAAMKERPDALTVEIEPIAGALRAGLAVAYYGPHDFVMVRLYADRRLEIIRVTEGFQWTWLHRATAPEPQAGALDSMSARVEGAEAGGDERLVIAMNGQDVFTLDDPRDVAGRFGLNLEGCEMRVRVLR